MEENTITLPEGKTHFDNWEAFKIDGPAKILILSDLHIPYHDRRSVEMALQYGKDNKVDTIILNGDIADFFSISFWENDPNMRNFESELDTVKQFLAYLRQEFPRKRILYKLGNHEERYERYMIVKAPEIFKVKMFQLENMFGLKDLNIRLVDELRCIRAGELNIIHGHEYKFAISNPVNPARGLFLKGKAHATCGHFHQSSYHTEKTIEEQVIATWSSGCLCDLHPNYRPYNNWSHGFQFVEVGSNGKFNMQNKIIRQGKIY